MARADDFETYLESGYTSDLFGGMVGCGLWGSERKWEVWPRIHASRIAHVPEGDVPVAPLVLPIHASNGEWRPCESSTRLARWWAAWKWPRSFSQFLGAGGCPLWGLMPEEDP